MLAQSPAEAESRNELAAWCQAAVETPLTATKHDSARTGVAIASVVNATARTAPGLAKWIRRRCARTVAQYCPPLGIESFISRTALVKTLQLSGS